MDNSTYAGWVRTASVDTIQSLAKKYFNKTINLDNIKSQDYIIVNSDNTITIAIGEGYELYNYKLVSMNITGTDNYNVIFECTKPDSTTGNYSLNINYTESEIVFLSLEKK